MKYQPRKKRIQPENARKIPENLPARIGAIVLFAFLAIAFALIVIMAAPQDDVNAILTDQPLMTASPAVTVDNENNLDQVLSAFPVSVLCCLPDVERTLISATVYDEPFEDGFARIAELQYALDDGSVIVLTSIYPARASSLLERDGYALIDTTELAGMEAVRMSREDSIRVHAQHSEAIYILTAPAMSYGELSGLSASIQRVSMTQ